MGKGSVLEAHGLAGGAWLCLREVPGLAWPGTVSCLPSGPEGAEGPMTSSLDSFLRGTRNNGVGGAGLGNLVRDRAERRVSAPGLEH